MAKYEKRFTHHFFIAAALMFAAYIVIYIVLLQGPFSHCVYDTYTRQAAAWWHGMITLPPTTETDPTLSVFKVMPWLNEIALYKGNYYVSFPPFPSVIQFILYPIFGMDMPDNLINTLFGLGALTLIYRFFMRRGFSGLSSAVLALLMTLGSNLLYLSAAGWVWFAAQTEAFFFSVLAVYLIFSKNKTAWYFAFLSLGFAFICRPFNLVYFPLLIYMLYKNLGGTRFWPTIMRCIKYVLPLAFVGICAAAYNYIRFDNIFQFGHDYIVEFENAKQFSLSYIPGNFMEILKLPGGSNYKFWPTHNGTLFFLVNPVYILLAVSLIRQKLSAKHVIYILCLLLHLLTLLAHKTMGGMQFGCRYLIDMIPFMLVIFAGDERLKVKWKGARALALPITLTVLGIAINVWGAAWYYTWWMQLQGWA